MGLAAGQCADEVDRDRHGEAIGLPDAGMMAGIDGETECDVIAEREARPPSAWGRSICLPETLS